MGNSTQFRLNATVMLNDISFGVVSDSIELTHGFGERTVEGASVGGGVIIQVISEDPTSAFGMLKFSLHTTLENHNSLVRLLESKNNGRISVSLTATNTSTGTTFSLSSEECTITNNPAVKFGPGGQFDIELQGRKFV